MTLEHETLLIYLHHYASNMSSLIVVERERSLEKVRSVRTVPVRMTVCLIALDDPVTALLLQGRMEVVQAILEMGIAVVVFIISFYIYSIIKNLIGTTLTPTLVTLLQACFIFIGLVVLVHAIKKMMDAFGIRLGFGGGGAGP